MEVRALTALLVRNAVRYRTELTEPQLEVYVADLRHHDPDALTAAFAWCARQGGRYFPTVPEVENAIRQLDLASGQALDGATAWAAFTRRVLGRYSFGVTKAFDWPDALTRTIVREQLGFERAAVHNLALLESDFEREKYRKRFVALYDDQRTLGAVRETVARAQLGERAVYESPPLPPPAPLRKLGGAE